MCVGGLSAAAGTVIPAMGVIGSVISGVSSYNSAQAGATASSYQAQIDVQNAQIATTNAVNERQAGYNESDKIALQTSSKVASQRAAMAANGIDSTAGTAADLTDTTKYFGEMDALTTVKNADNRAAAYMSQAQNFMMQSGLASQTAENYKSASVLSGLGTMATGLGQVGSSWYNYTKAKTSLPTKTYNP